ncbi:MAG: outer membrane beta-barrel protein [Saprospiraceae bacterium]|nr:outer membrane beta-barrel protein [Saprospiraceae bacterium]
MNKTFLSFLIIPFFITVNCLQSQNTIAGLSIAANQNNFLINEHEKLIDSYIGKGSYDIGIFFQKELKGNLSLHTGLNYSENSLEGYFNVNEVKYEFHNKIKYYSIPFLLHYDFTNLFFIRSGITIDYEIEKSRSINESQSGLGALLSLGIQYTKNHFYCSISPQIKINTLVRFKEVLNDYNLWNYGIHLAGGYRF